MDHREDIRVAWLFPSLRKGNYWHPIFRDFSQRFQTIIYTGLWPGFSSGLEDTFKVEVVGKTEFGDYSARFTYASPNIVWPLLKFRPHLIFASGFSIWTILVVLLKPLMGWCVVVLYDGSSPSIDFRNSWLRLSVRRFIAYVADGFCANSSAARDYLLKVLNALPEKVFSNTYLVPDIQALVQINRVAASTESLQAITADPNVTTFLFVGELIPRKGLRQLLQACALLTQSDNRNYHLLIVGDGEERAELEEFAHQQNLSSFVTWVGWIPYGELGTYFKLTDAFVFPTLEDVWGMVSLEAMVFGQPVLCSKWAGSAELIVPGENGELFDPHQPEELAALMDRVIQNPMLLKTMGVNAQQMIAPYTPEAAVESFATVVHQLIGIR